MEFSLYVFPPAPAAQTETVPVCGFCYMYLTGKRDPALLEREQERDKEKDNDKDKDRDKDREKDGDGEKGGLKETEKEKQS